MTNWKSELAVCLHDPPSKCLDIATHGQRSDAAFRQAGFVGTEVGEYFQLDHAAAANRLRFRQILCTKTETHRDVRERPQARQARNHSLT
jgi:hypothetical protein